jgi:hypothetical protein
MIDLSLAATPAPVTSLERCAIFDIRWVIV